MRTLFIIICCAVSFASSAQKSLDQVDFSSLVKEIYQARSTGRQTYGVFWIPTVYWDLVLKKFPEVPSSSIETIKADVKDYIIVSVFDAELKTNNYESPWQMRSEYDLRKSINIEFDGKKYLPIEQKDLPPTLSTLKSIMEPLFANMLGDFGNGMNFFFFEVQDKKGNNLIDPYNKQSFKLSFGDKYIEYNLPLPSLGNDKICKEDNTIFPSNYNYCPFHGSLLEEVKEEEPMSPPTQDDYEK